MPCGEICGAFFLRVEAEVEGCGTEIRRGGAEERGDFTL